MNRRDARAATSPDPQRFVGLREVSQRMREVAVDLRDGRLQRDAGVVHVVAEVIEDISPLLDRLLHPDFRPDIARAGDQP